MNYESKRKTFFYLIIATFLLIIGSFITIFILNIETSNKLSLIALIGIILTGLILFFKRKFDFYDFITKYNQLIFNTNKPFNVNHVVTSNEWISSIVRKGYKVYVSYKDFDLLYKFEKVKDNNKRSKTVLIIVAIKTNISFESNSITRAINDLEDKFYKTEKFQNHIIMNFKTVASFTNDNKVQAENIAFTKQGKNHYIIVINSLYSIKEKQIYFIHNEQFHPNPYYSFAVDEIQSLLE